MKDIIKRIHVQRVNRILDKKEHNANIFNLRKNLSKFILKYLTWRFYSSQFSGERFSREKSTRVRSGIYSIRQLFKSKFMY